MGDVDDIGHGYRGSGRPGDGEIARLADRQHGRVAGWQLKGLGFSQRRIDLRLSAGRLHREFNGVYAVGHRVATRQARWMAAVLACGSGAVLSHKAAIALHWLRPWRGGPIDVTVPGRSKRGQRGINVHNVRSLDPRDCTEVDGIPVTTVSRALLDFAEGARPEELQLALEAADRAEVLNVIEIDAVIARNPGRRGLRPLRAELAKMRGPAPWTQSENERVLLAGARKAGLPEPSVNVIVEGELVDFVWPQYRLIIEVDSYHFHKTHAAFNSDRRRDKKLKLAGWTVVRIDEDLLKEDLAGVIRDIAALLRAAGWRG